MSKTVMKLALEALEESLGYVEEEAENAQRLYGQYPTRQARIQGLKDDVRKHMKAITALREALAQDVPEVSFGNTALDKMGENARALGLNYEPPAAQRQWVGLTDEEKRQMFEREDYQGWLDYINTIEAKLKEKNT